MARDPGGPAAHEVFPDRDTLRIMRSRGDHLARMHPHVAEEVVSGPEIPAEIERDDTPPPS